MRHPPLARTGNTEARLARDSATVRDIYAVLLERRRIAYTTVMTMRKILESKGYLNKRRQKRAFVYQPAHRKDHGIGKMVQEFMERVFNGSVAPSPAW